MTTYPTGYWRALRLELGGRVMTAMKRENTLGPGMRRHHIEGKLLHALDLRMGWAFE